jgi:hypothetical protein
MDPDVRANTAAANAEVAAAAVKQRAAVEAARNVGTVAALVPQASAGELATFSTVAPEVASNVGELYSRLIAIATERLALYGRQLAAAYAESGVDALRGVVHIVDPETGTLVPNAEKPTGLVMLEMEERRTLERLIIQGARLGIEKSAAESLARNGTILVTALRTFAEAMGMDWQNELVRRRMQSALIAARAAAERADQPPGATA